MKSEQLLAEERTNITVGSLALGMSKKKYIYTYIYIYVYVYRAETETLRKINSVIPIIIYKSRL